MGRELPGQSGEKLDAARRFFGLIEKGLSIPPKTVSKRFHLEIASDGGETVEHWEIRYLNEKNPLDKSIRITRRFFEDPEQDAHYIINPNDRLGPLKISGFRKKPLDPSNPDRDLIDRFENLINMLLSPSLRVIAS